MGTLAKYLLAALLCGLPTAARNVSPGAVRPAPVYVELLFAGDVMQHLPQVEAARRGEGFDYDACFALVRPLFQRADLAVVNLETTLTRRPHYTGYPLFRSPAALAGALRRAGVDVAVMANNHCCDGGREGIDATLAIADSCGIRRTGVFRDSADYAARNPLYVTRRGVRFALLNYTYGTNGMPVPAPMRVNGIDTVQIARDLAAATAAGADCRVVVMHWGNEYERCENASQRALAAFLRRHGADIVVGSHPHVIQPFEADSTHVVLYSLGNFVSNQRRRYTDGGLMARIRAAKHPDGRMTYSLEPIPVWVALPGYRIIPPAAADTLALPPRYREFREETACLVGSDL